MDDSQHVPHLPRLFRIGWPLACVLALLVSGCGGGSGAQPLALSADSPATAGLQSNCSGTRLRDKEYFLTIRNGDASDLWINDIKLENISRAVSFEEVLLGSQPYVGVSVPLPPGVPRHQELEITLLAADRGMLPTCLAQVYHTVQETDDAVIVTRLDEISPTIGIRGEAGLNDFESVCKGTPTIELHTIDNRTVQLQPSICYTGKRVGSAVSFKYELGNRDVSWESENSNTVSVSASGLATANGPGPVQISAALMNARGTLGITSTGSGANPQGVPLVSMSSASIQEGSSGIKAVEFTMQRATASNVDLQVEYATTQHSAIAGSDYCRTRECDSTEELRGTVAIGAGILKSAPIKIFINGDTIAEVDEAFLVTLTPQEPGAAANTAEITLVNDDGPQSHVYATGVGLTDLDAGDISLRAPAPEDAAFLVWNQHSTKLGTVHVSNKDLGNTFSVISEYLVGGGGIARDGGRAEACFVAQIPPALLATTDPAGTNTYTVRGADILSGAGMVVVKGLVGSFVTPALRFTEGLQDVATFADVQEDASGHQAQIKAGCDFFYHLVDGQENSRVTTFQFAAVPRDRVAKITFFAHGADPGRGSEILFMAGSSTGTVAQQLQDVTACSGARNTDCVRLLGSDLSPSRPALVQNNDDAWDTFGQHTGRGLPQVTTPLPTLANADPDLRGLVIIPAGAATASFQLISPPARDGDSGTLSFAVLELFP